LNKGKYFDLESPCWPEKDGIPERKDCLLMKEY